MCVLLLFQILKICARRLKQSVIAQSPRNQESVVCTMSVSPKVGVKRDSPDVVKNDAWDCESGGDHYLLLADAIYGLEDPFIASGVCNESAQSAKNITIDYKRKDGQNASITFPQAPASDRNVDPPKETSKWTKENYLNFGLTPEFSAFLDDCEASPFGHGAQTVFDNGVRKALQIPGSRINSVSFDVENELILEEVQRKLVPLCGVPIEATLDKLNVYGEGGHFKAHRDTPRDERCFGTLVVCLPSSFAGGDFDVWHGQKEKSVVSLNWNQKAFPQTNGSSDSYYLSYVNGSSSANYGTNKERGIHRMMTAKPPSCVQWAAFFGDCEHEISQVKAGYRITLTYILRYSKVPAVKIPRTVATVTAVNAPTAASTASTSSTAAAATAAAATASASTASAPSPDTVTANAASPPPPDYKKMKVAELKNLCRSRGLTVGGNKDELIERLQNVEQGVSNASLLTAPEKVLTPYADDVAVVKGKFLYTVLRRALLDPDFMSSGGIMGVPCFHMYERASDLPSFTAGDGGKQEDVKGSDLRMKGADAFVYLAAARLGLSPKVFTIMTESCCDETVALCPSWMGFEEARSLTSPTMIEDSFLARALDLESLQSCNGSLEIGDKKISINDLHEHIDWLISLPTLRYSETSLYPAKPVPLIECFTSGTGYFGNEASDNTVYANAVIAIPVPPYEERCKSNPKLLKKSSLLVSTASSSTADAAEGEEEEDFAFFKGTKASDAFPKEEKELAEKRFKAFTNSNKGFTLPELRQAANNLGLSSAGTAKQISSRINRAMNRRQYGDDDDEYGGGGGSEECTIA